MSYTIQNGIVLTSVCGEYLLIATRAARNICPNIKKLNASGAYFWSMLEEGMDAADMATRAAEHYGAPRELIERDLKVFLAGLRQQNYISEAEE